VKHIKNCNHCDLLLTEDNWYISNVKKYNYICNPCDTIKNRKNKLKRLALTIGQVVYGKYDKVKRGHIYVVSNPAWKGWYKVGMAVDASDRCSSYQTSSPFRDYMIEYTEYFDDRREAEKTIHSKLKKNKIEHVNEWFKADLNIIKNTIKNIKDVQHEA